MKESTEAIFSMQTNVNIVQARDHVRGVASTLERRRAELHLPESHACKRSQNEAIACPAVRCRGVVNAQSKKQVRQHELSLFGLGKGRCGHRHMRRIRLVACRCP